MSDSIHILLAEDDHDDCFLFSEAVSGIPMSIKLSFAKDGEQLMDILKQNTSKLPTVLFLDLNMPRKNGFECLAEIKLNEDLKKLPVVVYSTSYQPEMVNQLYDYGAQHYIRKPSEFQKLRQIIHQALTLTAGANTPQPAKDKFVL